MTLEELFHAIATDPRAAEKLLRAHAAMASAALVDGEHFISEISQQVYAGDTALHIAGAAYRAALVPVLVTLGAGIDAANRRKQQPLLYAVNGNPASTHWDPPAQVATIRALLDAGADVNAADAGGTTALHRAVRNRCADAVEALLARGADPSRKNSSGSTPARLANHTTGRGGTGSDEAKEQQRRIVELLGCDNAAR